MANCNIPNNNPLEKECVVDESTLPTPTTSCTTANSSAVSCPQNDSCSPWNLSNLASDTCLMDAYIEEQLNIGAAVINVYKLLGVHEQGKLQDLTGKGNAISGGDIPNYPAINAFDKFITEWRSRQLGADVIAKAYIGYDFGEIKLANGRNRYGLETFVRHDVASFKIKQGCNAANRVTKVRVERSNDGTKWYGVGLVDLPDCDGLTTVQFARSVPSRWWRLRPVQFNGISSDYWVVQALQLMDFEATRVANIQDRIFLENRDRDYDESLVEIKGSYAPLELQTFQSKFGMSNLFGGAETYSIEVSFAQCVNRLGRPLVIGDILQLPSETQYTPSLKPVLKYLEITDIAWSTNGYTPNWKPTLQRVMAAPVLASQETQDILGKLTADVDSSGLMDINDGATGKTYQDVMAISQTVEAKANSQVPERGEDYAGVTKLSDDVLNWGKERGINMRKLDRNRNVYGVDAMPPNALPYTQGDAFPSSPKDKDYHRMTYTYVNNSIPPRLYRYNATKNRWIYLETDRRFEHKNSKAVMDEFLNPDTSTVTNPKDLKEELK
jgi:hypothetical protein